MTRAILHVDMDAFYASVAQRDRPELRGEPVIVGGHPKRGVVLAASYEVRPFGVRSAMPMSRALAQAPQAIVVPPDFTAYVEASEQVFAIFHRYTPLVESLSLDEAFLDVTASMGLFGPPSRIAEQIRTSIAQEVRLPASAGIASTKFVAKLVTDLAKPNGQKEVSHEETLAFLRPLPVARLWGVGPHTEEALRTVGIHTIGDIADKPQRWLEEKLGERGQFLWELAHGLDDRPVIPDRAAKSIGAEDTFEEDLTGVDLLRPHLHSQALRVGRRLRLAGAKARGVQLKVKRSDFTLLTRSTTFSSPTDDGQTLYRAAFELLERLAPQGGVRLTGVSAQGLVGESDQLALFQPAPQRADRLNAALDRIADKFGSQAVVTADLAADEGGLDDGREGTGFSRLDAARSERDSKGRGVDQSHRPPVRVPEGE